MNPLNVMQPGTWAVLAVVTLAIAVPGIIVLVRALMARPRWRKLDVDGLTIQVAGDAPDAEIAHALRLALSALEFVWPASVLNEHVELARIWVRPVERWQNIVWQWVGGEQDGDLLSVNRSMTSLAHELGHWFQLTIDHQRDDAHLGWAAKKLWDADNKYRLSLGA